MKLCTNSHDKTLVRVLIRGIRRNHYLTTVTAITGKQYKRVPTADLVFPDASDVINNTTSHISRVHIPQSLIKKHFEALMQGGKY